MAPSVISRRPHPRDGAGETFDSATTESEYSSVAPANDAIGWIRRAEAARVQASPRREDRACDARRTMRSLSARDERIKRSKRASIFDGFLSSPIRVFYSILFICALEVRAVDDDDSPAPRGAAPRATRTIAAFSRPTTDARAPTTGESTHRFYSGPWSWFPVTRRALGTTRRRRITRARRCVQITFVPVGDSVPRGAGVASTLTLTFHRLEARMRRGKPVSHRHAREDARD